MKFFGIRHRSAAYLDSEHVAAPIGALCVRCGEAIAPYDDGWLVPNGPGVELAFHRACFMRQIVGSVAHQQRKCSCFVPGSTTDDEPTLTRRQAAEAATDYFDRAQRKLSEGNYE